MSVSGIRHLFFGFDSETVIGDGFTRFENPVSVSTNGSRFFVEPDFGFESETGFSFGIYVKQTVSI